MVLDTDNLTLLEVRLNGPGPPRLSVLVSLEALLLRSGSVLRSNTKGLSLSESIYDNLTFNYHRIPPHL